MTGTALYDAQDALLALVKGLDSIGGWRVDLGFPAGANVQAKHVWVAGDVDDATQQFGLSGLAAKDETFDLRVHVVATAKARTFDVPRDRVRVIGDELAAALVADFTLGGVVELAQVSSVRVDDAQPDESTRQVMHTATVTCRSWLT